MRSAVLLVLTALATAGCAARREVVFVTAPAPEARSAPAAKAAAKPEALDAPTVAEKQAGMEAAKERVAFLKPVPETRARRSMPMWPPDRPLPNLAMVAAYMPKTWRAEMTAWQALQQEGTLDKRLLAGVFWVVSLENECFY